MGLRQAVKKAIRENKKKKEQDTPTLRSVVKNVRAEFANKEQDTIIPVPNELVRRVINEADKNPTSSKANIVVNDLISRIRRNNKADDSVLKDTPTKPILQTASHFDTTGNRPFSAMEFSKRFWSDDVPWSPNYYNNIPDNEDFEEYVKMGKSRVDIFPKNGEKYDPKKHGNKVEAARINKNASKAYGGEDSLYAQMTDEEVNIYNYLLGKQGYDVAENYLSKLRDGLTIRRGEEWADNVKKSEGIGRAGMYTVASIGGGLDQAFRGFDSVSGLVGLNDEAAPVTSMEIANNEIIKDLDGVGYYLYGAGNTVGNMIPSIMAGSVGGRGAQAAVTGVLSAGGDYRQGILE